MRPSKLLSSALSLLFFFLFLFYLKLFFLFILFKPFLSNSGYLILYSSIPCDPEFSLSIPSPSILLLFLLLLVLSLFLFPLLYSFIPLVPFLPLSIPSFSPLFKLLLHCFDIDIFRFIPLSFHELGFFIGIRLKSRRYSPMSYLALLLQLLCYLHINIRTLLFLR